MYTGEVSDLCNSSSLAEIVKVENTRILNQNDDLIMRQDVLAKLDIKN